MIYFISDMHFGDKGIINWCHRPYESLDDMRDKMIVSWNQVVKPIDTVFILGDISKDTFKNTKDIISKLNGDKILVKGNHDKRFSKEELMQMGFVEIHEKPLPLYLSGFNLILSHEPVETLKSEINIHGHLHDDDLLTYYKKLDPKNHICICVERIEYKPINWLKIMEIIKERGF